MASELLQQVRVLDPVSETDRIADVLLIDGVIHAVEATLTQWPAGTEVRNCQGLVLGPGLVELYSHSGEPGFEERETLNSLMQAAAAGGFTRIAILPDTVPVVHNPATLALIQARTQALHQGETTIQIDCWGALTLDIQGQQMTELAELAAAGVIGFSDGHPIRDLSLLRRVLEYLRPLTKPICLWPCNRVLAGTGVMREGPDSIRLGLPGNPAIAESTALAALLECVEATETPVHIMRVSTARSVTLIQDAKTRGLPITASTPWMHLLLNTSAVATYDPSLRVEPPLGNPSDQAALVQGVQQGIIDAIAIDHIAYTYEEKTVPFSVAPAGAIGLELALALLWQELVVTGKYSALELWSALSTKPALCLQQPPAAIAPERPAEIILFAPQQPWSVTEQTLKSQGRNTPWFGQEVIGRVIQIWSPATQRQGKSV